MHVFLFLCTLQTCAKETFRKIFLVVSNIKDEDIEEGVGYLFIETVHQSYRKYMLVRYTQVLKIF